MLKIVEFTLGPVQTNAYLVADLVTCEAAVIDPGWDGQIIIDQAQRNGWKIKQLLITHAHFDHLGGAAAIAKALKPNPLVGLHPADRDLWNMGGGGMLFGFNIEPGPEPGIDFFDNQVLDLGENQISVFHTPGHTPGHCVFYCSSDQVLFSGDLIFQQSVGRTDLPGGNYDSLLYSIKTRILVLPDETRILSGHGPETDVGSERRSNPFLRHL